MNPAGVYASNPPPLATAEFTTLRLCLIKIGTCITETATRVRIAFTAASPEAALFAALVRGCLPAGLNRAGFAGGFEA